MDCAAAVRISRDHSPTSSIASLKKLTTRAYLQGKITP
jgi:hypothetical protein